MTDGQKLKNLAARNNGNITMTFLGKEELERRFSVKNLYFEDTAEKQAALIAETDEAYIIDTETTGLNEIGTDLPWEIAIKHIKLGKGASNPEQFKSEIIRMRVHGVPDVLSNSEETFAICHTDIASQDFFRKAVSLEDGAKRLVEFMRMIPRASRVFAHNAQYDVDILNNLLRYAGVRLLRNIEVWDTMAFFDLAINKWGRNYWNSKSLDFIIPEVLNQKIDLENRHGADYDTRMTSNLLFRCVRTIATGAYAIPSYLEKQVSGKELGDKLAECETEYVKNNTEYRRLMAGIHAFFVKNEARIGTGLDFGGFSISINEANAWTVLSNDGREFYVKPKGKAFNEPRKPNKSVQDRFKMEFDSVMGFERSGFRYVLENASGRLNLDDFRSSRKEMDLEPYLIDEANLIDALDKMTACHIESAVIKERYSPLRKYAIQAMKETERKTGRSDTDFGAVKGRKIRTDFYFEKACDTKKVFSFINEMEQAGKVFVKNDLMEDVDDVNEFFYFRKRK